MTGDALAAAAALRDLAAGATTSDDATYLTKRYLAGDDLELDVGAELFLALGPDAIAPMVVGLGAHEPAPSAAVCIALRTSSRCRSGMHRRAHS